MYALLFILLLTLKQTQCPSLIGIKTDICLFLHTASIEPGLLSNGLYHRRNSIHLYRPCTILTNTRVSVGPLKHTHDKNHIHLPHCKRMVTWWKTGNILPRLFVWIKMHPNAHKLYSLLAEVRSPSHVLSITIHLKAHASTL